MISLGDLPGGQLNSHAAGVSADGSVIVGRGSTDAGSEAFRWTQASGMVGLGDLSGGLFHSSAHRVSSDGSVVVGQSSSASGTEAFLWDATHGMRSFRDVLVSDFGLSTELAGWTLTSANDISADGKVIVGYGFNPNGDREAWIARLAPPTTLFGDFNNDGTVDAADYVVWRKNLAGIYTQNDYNTWRAHFGTSLGPGSGTAGYPLGASAVPLSAAVPEPPAGVLIVIGFIVALAIRSRRVTQGDVRFMTMRLCKRNLFHSTAFSTIVAAVSALLLATMTAAANYSFTKIADISGPFSRFNSFSINDNGKVAFIALLDAGGVGIFTGDGGPTALMVDDSGPFSGFGDIFTVRGGVSINNSDQVAFFGNIDVGGAGIFTTSGGNVTTIADTNGLVFRFADGGPSINDSGTVAFFAELDAGGGAILSGNGGPLTTIADNGGPGPIRGVDPSINNGGAVAFIANFNTGPTVERGIFTGSGGPTSLIVDGSGPLSANSIAFSPAINDRGTVVYHAQFDTAAGETGIFIGAGTIIVDSSGPFSRSFGHKPAINNRGTVAFNALLDAGGLGIFTGPDPVADKVIRTGDSLFGSTVTAIGFGGELNDNGDIPFIYGLANGGAGIAVAQRQPNVPVPSQIPQPELFAEASVEFRTNTPAGFKAFDDDTAAIPGRADAHASHPDFPTNTAFADAYAEVPVVPMSTADLGKVGSRSYGESPLPSFGGHLDNPTHARAEARQIVKLTAIPDPGTNVTDPVDIDMTLHFDGSLQQRLIGIWECESPCDPVSFPDPGQLTTLVSTELNTFTGLGRVTQFEASATLDWTGTEALKLTATGPWAADFTPLVQPRQGLVGGSSVSSTQSLEDILSLAAGEEFTVELILRTEVFNHYISTRLAGISLADFFNSGAVTFSTDTPGVTIVLVPDALPGDFNNDSTVDAADYVVWRKGLATGTYTQADYNIWRENFGALAAGAAAGANSLLQSAVPEPAALALAGLPFVLLVLRRNQSTIRTSAQHFSKWPKTLLNTCPLSARMRLNDACPCGG